jgi:transposase
MDRIVGRCAGLDVHKDSLAACVRVPAEGGRREQETRTFMTTCRGLVAFADWLRSHGVTLVGMESTGVSWKPVYYLLEDEFECWLLNAHQLRARGPLHRPPRPDRGADARLDRLPRRDGRHPFGSH